MFNKLMRKQLNMYVHEHHNGISLVCYAFEYSCSEKCDFEFVYSEIGNLTIFIVNILQIDSKVTISTVKLDL